MSRICCALLLAGLLVAGCGEKREPSGVGSDTGVGSADRAELPPQLAQVEHALAGSRFTVQAVPPARTHPKAAAELRIFEGATPVGRVAQWRALGRNDLIRLSQFGRSRVTMVICGRTAFAPVGHPPGPVRAGLFELITGSAPLDCARLIST